MIKVHLTLTLTTLIALTSQVIADELIYKSSLHFNPRINFTYKINERADRAWLTVEFQENDSPPQDPRHLVDINPKGVSLNLEEKAIIFEDVSCAHYKYKGRGLFKRLVIKSTGNCDIQKSYTYEQVDTGTDIFTVRFLNLHFKSETPH